MDDDVWDDEGHEHHGNNKDLEKLQDIHMNEGYKAGIVAGQSHSAQQGFDEGYLQGANYSIEFGKTLGMVQGLSKVNSSEERSGRVEELLKEGQRLSQEAGKGLSGEEIEKWLANCNEIIAEVTGGKLGSRRV